MIFSNDEPKRIPAKEALAENGTTLEDLISDDPGVCPACCSELCQVEYDGVCPHGFPSVFIALGM